MSPPSPPRDSAPDRRLLRRSLEFVRPHARTLLGVLALALVLSSLSAVDPLIMKFLFDLLGSEGDLRQFALAMGALLVAELGRALLTARLGTSSWDLRLKVEYAVRERVTAKLNALPVAYHQREGVGGLINVSTTCPSGVRITSVGIRVIPNPVAVALFASAFSFTGTN